MALQKIGRGMLNTGVSDSSDATAITIDSSENSTFAGNVTSPRFILNGTDSATTRYIFTDNTNTGDGRLIIQSGGGSAGYGGSINLYSHSHASKPGDVVAGISSGSGGSFRVNTSGIDGGSDVFVAKADGKVGIGTASPVFKLHLKDGANTAVYQKFTNDTTGNTSNDGSTIGIDADGDLIIANAEAKEQKFYTNDTQRMTIDSSGRLLVGKNSSTSPELGGSNAIGEFVGSASGRLNVLRLSNSYTVSTGTASSAIVFGAHTNGARDNAVIEVQNTANGGDAIEYQIHLRDASNSMVENFTMRYDGDIHLNQTRSDSHLYIGSEGGAFGGNSSNWMRASSSSLMFNAATQHVFEVGGSNRGTITGSSATGVFSDRDMKENIADIDIGLSEVLQLQPRKFKYKLGPRETYGFIAQEVETVVPLIVDETTVPEPDPEANKTTLKTLDTIPIIAALVKSVQELEARIKTLEG